MKQKQGGIKKRVAAVTFFGAGKIYSSTGQLIFGIIKFLDYWKYTSAVPFITIVSLSGVSTFYVRAWTRIPALWRQFSPEAKKTKDGHKLWPDSKIERATVIIVGTIGVASGLVDTLQAYLGHKTILQLLNGDTNYVEYSTGAYIVISSMGTYYAFTVSNTIENTISLIQKFKNRKQNQHADQTDDIIVNNSHIGSLSKAITVGLLGTAGFGAFAYFTVRDFLTETFPGLPPYVIQLCSYLALFTILVATALSRGAETYKYFHSAKPIPINDLTAKQILVLTPHILLGVLDIIVFGLSFYIASIVTISGFGVAPESLIVRLFSILPALSGAFYHYVFSVRPIINVAVEAIKINVKKSLANTAEYALDKPMHSVNDSETGPAFHPKNSYGTMGSTFFKSEKKDKEIEEALLENPNEVNVKKNNWCCTIL